MITSDLNTQGKNPILVIKTVLDEDFFHAIERGEYSGLGSRIAMHIAQRIYPEMENRIMSDPTFKDRIVNEVLILLANKVADKKSNEKSN
jgi:hypothetical protein